MTNYTPHQSKYFAHVLMRDGLGDYIMNQSLSSAKVDLNPHQVDAAMFALRSPVSKGVILADEVGLGKTIEAALVIAQRWWERRRLILLIVPASLRKQWAQELRDKFSLPSQILDAKRVREIKKQGVKNPFDNREAITILSYEYAARMAVDLQAINWSIVVFDEAHKMRNVYKALDTSRAAKLRAALADRQKLLLTATPLQNNLMELFGLVSVIDEHFFGSPDTFKAEFGGREDKTALNILGRRLEPICKRTLRRQVQKAGLINYTNRIPKTFDFTPSRLEAELYEKMSQYLQRNDTLAVGKNGRHLVTLVLRKILGSSSFAIAATLDKMVTRLNRRLPADEAALDDYDAIGDTADDWREGNQAEEADALEAEADQAAEAVDPELLKLEIAELTQYRDLASSLASNAKGKALLDCLPSVLKEIKSKGGQEKAVIFTESVRTQAYLRGLLESQGFQGQTVILNGSNTDKDSQAIYNAWLLKHRGTDAISGSKSADMKAAIVDAFKNDRSILIATESGAEGINLQFCSLIINYDLPWNPQRVEQRIGRCHRYGQKIDVTVVNFMNRGNQAEARIVQLLDSKFKLFDGVFGSSDEVLGAIESGVDVERRILDIVQNCRSDEDINKAFDQLQLELSFDIDAAKTNARDQILSSMDDKVVERLQLQKASLHQQLSSYQRFLMLLAKAELSDAQFHTDHAQRFDYKGQTYTAEWPLADDNGWRFFRVGDGTLADSLINQAINRPLETAFLTFDYAQYQGNLADIHLMKGKKGWLSIAKLNLSLPDRDYDEIIAAGIDDDGQPLSAETIGRLMIVPAKVYSTTVGSAPHQLPEMVAERQSELVDKTQTQLGSFLEEENERLENWREDAKVSFEGRIKALDKEAREMTKQARSAKGLQEKVEMQRQAGNIKREADALKQAYFTRLAEIDAERERMLDEISAKLDLTPTLETLFTIRWEIAA